MTQAHEDDDGIHIHISGVRANSSDTKEDVGSRKRGDYAQFERTGVSLIQVERLSERGPTPVQSLGFEDDEQRLSALKLLSVPEIYAHLPAIFELIFRMGDSADGEHCYYAAAAAAQMARVQPFDDIKRRIIAPWARSQSRRCRYSASVALAECLAFEEWRAEVLALTHHWCTSENVFLADVAMTAFAWSNGRYPDEALGAIEDVLGTKMDWLRLLGSIKKLFRSVYEIEPDRAVNFLGRWIKGLEDASDGTPSWVAALLVLEFLRIEDAVLDSETGERCVDLLYRMWEGLGLPLLDRRIQEETTWKVKDWAETALELIDKKKGESMEEYRALFRAFDDRYRGRRRNRLRRELERWQRQREREQQRQLRRSREASAQQPGGASFLDLIEA